VALSKAGIIAFYTSKPATLDHCIMCLEKQSAQRVLIVDNSEEADLSTTDLANAEILHPSENIGFGVGANLGITKADSEFTQLLNPDAFPELGWLDTLLNAADANPQCAAFGCV